MSQRPTILVVDDEPGSLTGLLNALTRRFGADYRVSAHLSAQTALHELSALKKSGSEVALVIADQWMPEMEGRDLLGLVPDLAPEAKRALLVEWGDRRSGPTILRACAFGMLDNYLLKPFEPAEIHLYPLISEFLAEWTRDHRPPLEVVRVIYHSPSRRGHELRSLFKRNGISHGFYEASSEIGQALLRESGIPEDRLPVVVMHDGRVLANPSNAELADALGVSSPRQGRFDLAIIGAGPAGLAAAVYAASEGLRTAVIEREAVGGQAGMSSLIRNYLGFPRGISGAELAQRAYQQAWLFGAKYVFAREVTGIEASGIERKVRLSDGRELTARAVLIATGASYRRLQLPQLEPFVGAGLYYTEPADPRVLKGLEVHVVGGGNSAGQAAAHLARYAQHVTLLVRGTALASSMSKYLEAELRHLPNVEVRFHAEVVDGGGTRTLEWIALGDRASGKVAKVRTDMVCAMIGADPHTEWLGKSVARDAHGFLLTGRDLFVEHGIGEAGRPPLRFETSLPGVFACGDVRFGSPKRVASAVGDGAGTVQSIHEYLRAPVSYEELATQPTGPVRSVQEPEVFV